MKILAIADVHKNELYQSMLMLALDRERRRAATRSRESQSAVGDPERLVLVVAGDLGHYLRESVQLLEAIEASRVPFLFVTGNHERDRHARERLRRNPQAVWLDERVIVLDGVVFMGLGYAEAGRIGRSRGITIRPRLSALARRLGQLEPEIRKNSPRVLVTHEPPKAFHKHGNQFIDRFAIQHGIKTIICGHIHVKEPTEVETEHFRVINPGPLGQLVEVGTMSPHRDSTPVAEVQ